MKVLIVLSHNSSTNYTFVDEQVDHLRKNGITIRYYGIIGKGISGYLKNLPDLRRTIVAFQPDIIHAHYGLTGLLANLQRRVPVVTTYHGSDVNVKYILPFSFLSMLLSVHNIYVSKKIRDKFFLKNKSSVIPCGVNLSSFVPIDKQVARKHFGFEINKRILLFAGSFNRDVKNYPLAMKAMDLLPGAELLELKGYNREQVNLLLNAVDVLLLTSFSEGSPQIIKEAMSCNCPIVSTDVGDVNYIMGETEGCYISPYDYKELAFLITKAIEYGKRTEGRIRIQSLCLDNESIAKKIIGIYSNAISTTNSHMN